MAITAATLQALAQLRLALLSITDAQARDLTAAWARAWDEVAADLDDALEELATAAKGGKVTRAQVAKSRRTLAALKVATDRLQVLAANAGVRMSGDVAAVVRQAGTMQASIIATQVPYQGQGLVTTWAQVSPRAIDAIVRRTTGQVTARLWPLQLDATRAMKRELMRGVAVGDNPRVAARRMVQRVQGRFNGGLARALNISRTEMLDAHRAGARLAQDVNADILDGWTWTAQLGPRTCAACWGKHGTDFPLSQPGPLGHQSCRCARTPKVKPWADLGFANIPEPDDLMPSAADAFAGLPTSVQRRILGAKGHDAWQRGDFPMDRWARLRHTPEWRDSWVPAPAPTR